MTIQFIFLSTQLILNVLYKTENLRLCIILTDLTHFWYKCNYFASYLFCPIGWGGGGGAAYISYFIYLLICSDDTLFHYSFYVFFLSYANHHFYIFIILCYSFFPLRRIYCVFPLLFLLAHYLRTIYLRVSTLLSSASTILAHNLFACFHSSFC